MLLIDVLDLIFGQQSSRVWVDHVDLSSDLDHDKDYVSAMVPGTVLVLTFRSTMGFWMSLTGLPL